MLQIPNKENKKWEELVTGMLTVKITNFFLRTKIEQIIEDTKTLVLSTEQAIENCYNLFYELSETRDISTDIKSIFGDIENPKIDKVQQNKNDNVKQKTDNHTTHSNTNYAEDAKQKIKDMEAEKERLRIASIERRNRQIKEEFEKNKKTSKKSFFRSLFNQ